MHVCVQVNAQKKSVSDKRNVAKLKYLHRTHMQTHVHVCIHFLRLYLYLKVLRTLQNKNVGKFSKRHESVISFLKTYTLKHTISICVMAKLKLSKSFQKEKTINSCYKRYCERNNVRMYLRRVYAINRSGIFQCNCSRKACTGMLVLAP